jgi:hypothetical protein
MPPLGFGMTDRSLGTDIGSSGVCGSSYSNCALIQGLAADRMDLLLPRRLGGERTQWYFSYAFYYFKFLKLQECTH